MPVIRLLAILALAVLCRSEAAHALACSATIDNIDFGIVDTLAAPQVDPPASATVTVNCTGAIVVLGAPVPPNVYVCANIGTGNGGTGNSPRIMAGTPAGSLGYQLYTDAARVNVWGTNYGTAFGNVPTIMVPLAGDGTGRGTMQLYARIPSVSNPVAAASYLSTFTSAHTRFDYGQILASLLGSCSLLGLPLTAQTNPTFTVSATINKNCLVNSDNIGFGSTGILSTARTANGRIGVRCTPQTTYTVSLGNGLTGTGPEARKMTKSSEAITYGLYRNMALSQPWGSTVGTNTLAGTGDGTQTNYTVYGRVPAQATPSAGLYSDTVVATVTY